jgi:hypothetical protein
VRLATFSSGPGQPEKELSWSFTSRIARDYDFGRNKRLE